MTFNSYSFILAFLPALLLSFFLACRLGRLWPKLILIAGGIVFYAFAGWDVAAILGISLAVNLAVSFLAEKTRPKKWSLVLAVVLNIGLLLYFKYLNFLIDIVNHLAHGTIEAKDLLLPLGISFFTFQQIMYVSSVWKKEIDRVRVLDYLAYILYFPKLIMGPLMEPTDFLAQINDPRIRKFSWDNFAEGLKIFCLGLFKKVVLADTFAKAVAWGFANGVETASSAPTATAGDLFLVALFYTFQIYFDFSGYSDMAVGASLMLNIQLPINFDSPYKATSIRDFWKRWHISLTSFLTKYVYFPLGGSKKGNFRTYLNIMIVFLVSGIWHGANWTFILWGLLHGLLQVTERLFKKGFGKLVDAVKWGYTFLSVNLLWLLFRSETISQWLEMLKTMFRFQDMSISDGLIESFVLPESRFLLDLLHLTQMNADVRGLGLLVFTVAAFLICLIPENNYRNLHKVNWFHMVLCAAAFVWSFLCLSSESVFVYYNF